MAKDKSGFLLYADYINTVEKLPDDKAGQLFKTILAYVNDLNPNIDDLLIQIAFEPIKQQLRRDLKSYEVKIKNYSDSGKKGMESRWGKNKEKVITNYNNVKKPITKITDNDTVNVNDNDNDTVNVNDTQIPPLEDFMSFAKGVVGNDFEQLKKSVELKYMAWKENGWKTGKDKKIKNWKSTLLNTIQYLEKEKTSGKKEIKQNSAEAILSENAKAKSL